MPLSFTDQESAEIKALVARYAERAAALLPVLHLTQEKFGHLSDEAQLLVAETLDVPPTRVKEVVTFYEMFHEHGEGQYHLEFCTNISCHLVGGEELLNHARQRLGIEVGHQTDDGIFGLMEVECLASCGSGPMMRVGDDYYEGLTPDAVDALIERFRKEAPQLNGKAYKCGKKGPHTGPVPGHEPQLVVIPKGAAAPAKPAPAPPPEPSSAAKSDPEKDAQPADNPGSNGKKKTSSEDLPSFEPPPFDKNKSEGEEPA